MSKTLTLAATGFAGLVLGAGIGMAAAAEPDGMPRAPERAATTSMDDMHAAMVDTMPAELAEQCNQMHASMGDHMGRAGGGMPGGHAGHHTSRGG